MGGQRKVLGPDIRWSVGDKRDKWAHEGSDRMWGILLDADWSRGRREPIGRRELEREMESAEGMSFGRKRQEDIIRLALVSGFALVLLSSPSYCLDLSGILNGCACNES